MDLSILPFLPAFFFVGDEANLAENIVSHLAHLNAASFHTLLCFPAIHLLVKCLCLALVSEDNAYQAVLYNNDGQFGKQNATLYHLHPH